MHSRALKPRPARRLPGIGRILSLIAFAAALPLGGALASGLPALVEPATSERHPGKMIFAELVTPSVADAERFYGGLLGWKFQDVPVQSTRYAAATVDGEQVAGLVEKAMPAGGRRRPAWLTFLSTRNVDATVGLALQHGAKVLFAPHDVPDLGREAVIADPQGGVFAALTSSSGDPGDYLADDGAWIWSSLITSDPGSAASFYNALFDYQIYNATDSTSGKHLVLASENFARASVNSYPANLPTYRPRWLNFVRVEDASSAASRVSALGGQVLVPAHADRDGDPIAIVADPQGAVFGLMQWSGAQPEEGAK